ncbi:Protein CBG26631 [Caenorhabditis briggsae]|nr:Protein CBG26631 [Caenorhabditis briggsae]CAS00782.1 Protein CBG26631 [Caenorhabditis briggsae]
MKTSDPSFSVHVVNNSENIIQKYGNSTAVILNTSLQNYKVSYLTEIIPNPETDLSFHFGFPTDGVKIQNTFFENPIDLPYYEYNGVIYNYTRQFFKTVEPIQIKLDYWYLTATGPVSMKIGGQFVPNYNYTTAASATTGLIMNNDNDMFQ